MRFGDFTFDESFRFATKASGETVKFTRSEQALLLVMVQHVGLVLPRQRLHEAVSRRAGVSTDRNIDFIINRLRVKLGDSARDPRCIATRYGEGYSWIAKPGMHESAEAFVAFGPVFGLEHLPSDSGGRAFLDALLKALQDLMPPERKVVLRERSRADAMVPDAAPFVIEISFHEDRRGLHCAAVLRDAGGLRILQALRLLIAHGEPAATARQVGETAAMLKTALWRRLSYGAGALAGPTDEPLELRMHGAAQLLARSDESWLENEAQLAQARLQNPDCPQTALMWAMHLYARLLLGASATNLDADARDALEREIETLVFDSLPGVQDNPVLVLAAAKLLCFIDRGHLDLAERLAEDAFALSTAFASAFAVLGQLRLCRGRLAEAAAFFDQGISLAEPHSEFHVFLMVLKCIALLASGDRARLEIASQDLYRIKPLTRLQLGIFIADPAQILPTDMRQLLSAFDAQHAGAVLVYFHYIFVRRLRQETHRENLLRGILAQMTRYLGAAVIPAEIWRSVPRLAPQAFAVE